MKRFIATSVVFTFTIAVVYFLPYGAWAELGGLPAHPLIVHGVVVLLPLISIFMLAVLFRKEIFKKYHLYIIGALGLSTVGVIAAKSSGDSLSAAVGLPTFHAEWGNNLVPLAIALFVLVTTFAYFSVYRSQAIVAKFLGGLVAVASIGSIGMTYVVGHSGAESAWKERYIESKASISDELRFITMDEVRLHNKSTDCWTVVGDSVYDVTTFVERHPAGSPAIKEMCGKNASEDFLGEHIGQSEPEKWLETLKIGTVQRS